MFRTGGIYTVAGCWREIAFQWLPTPPGGCILRLPKKRGRTGFDCWFETQAACRGSLVGHVKLLGKPINAKANITEVDFSGNSEQFALAA